MVRVLSVFVKTTPKTSLLVDRGDPSLVGLLSNIFLSLTNGLSQIIITGDVVASVDGMNRPDSVWHRPVRDAALYGTGARSVSSANLDSPRLVLDQA